MYALFLGMLTVEKLNAVSIFKITVARSSDCEHTSSY